MCLRLVDRARWHIHGLLLWLLQRPSLRYAPFPYPTVQTVSQWELQAEQMGASGALSRNHASRARQAHAYNATNLEKLTWLRNRVGLQLAFLEDGLLTGMLAARAQRGTAQTLRRAAIAEAHREANRLAEQGQTETAIRQLIGPRGGLPHLKQDLLKLAALLHVEVPEKATIEDIKKLCRPMLKELASPVQPSAKSKSNKLQAEKVSSSVGDGPVSKTPPAELPHRSQVPQEGQNPGVTAQEVSELIRAQDQRFQSMLSQVMQHLVNVQANPMPTMSGSSAPCTSWNEVSEIRESQDVEMDWDEIQRLNAEHRMERRQERLEAQHGEGYPSDLEVVSSD